jgi:hypothetical protein
MSKVHYLNPGPFPVHIGFTTCEKAFNREVKRIGVNGEVEFLASEIANATTHFFRNDHNSLCCIITMPPQTDDKSREQYAALLAHEGLHVVQEMRELNRSEPFDHETEAYLLQMIVQEFLQVAWNSDNRRMVAP